MICTVLTGLPAPVLFGVGGLLSGLLFAVTGQQSTLAMAVSTPVITALFNAQRRRVQGGARDSGPLPQG